MKIYYVNIHVQVGVPPWIVEARHAAAHGLLPPMSTFRACMDFGLQWLKVRYWDVMMLKMEDKGKDKVPREGEEELYGTQRCIVVFHCRRCIAVEPLLLSFHGSFNPS